jgi:hypothetical protein
LLRDVGFARQEANIARINLHDPLSEAVLSFQEVEERSEVTITIAQPYQRRVAIQWPRVCGYISCLIPVYDFDRLHMSLAKNMCSRRLKIPPDLWMSESIAIDPIGEGKRFQKSYF